MEGAQVRSVSGQRRFLERSPPAGGGTGKQVLATKNVRSKTTTEIQYSEDTKTISITFRVEINPPHLKVGVSRSIQRAAGFGTLPHPRCAGSSAASPQTPPGRGEKDPALLQLLQSHSQQPGHRHRELATPEKSSFNKVLRGR